MPASAAAFSTAAVPPSTIRSASDTCLPPALPLKPACTPSSTASTFASRAGSFAAQSFCGARRTRAPLAPPRLSPPRKVEAEAQAANTRSGTDAPLSRIVALSAAMSAASIGVPVAFGSGSCQVRSSAGTSGPR